MMAVNKFVLEDLQNMCRLCHSTISLVDIFDSRLWTENMAEVVEVTTGVKISPNDDVSHMLCIKCSRITMRMYEFRSTSIKSDMELLAKAKKQKSIHKSVKNIFRKYPKLSVPTSVTKLNISPCIILERNDDAFRAKYASRKFRRKSTSSKELQDIEVCRSTGNLSSINDSRKLSRKKSSTNINSGQEENDRDEKLYQKKEDRVEKESQKQYIEGHEKNYHQEEKADQNKVEDSDGKIIEQKMGKVEKIRKECESEDLSRRRDTGKERVQKQRDTEQEDKIARIQSEEGERKKKRLENGEEESEIVESNNPLFIIKEKFKKVYTCKVCNNLFYTKKELQNHEKRHRRCALCKGVFGTLELTSEHQKTCSVRKMMSNLPIVKITRCDKDERLREKYKSGLEILNTLIVLSDSDFEDNDSQSNEQNDEIFEMNVKKVSSRITSTDKSDIETIEVEMDDHPGLLRNRKNSSHFTQKNLGSSGKTDQSNTLESLCTVPHVTAETSLQSDNSRTMSPIDVIVQSENISNNLSGNGETIIIDDSDVLVSETSSVDPVTHEKINGNISIQANQPVFAPHPFEIITCETVVPSPENSASPNSNEEAPLPSSSLMNISTDTVKVDNVRRKKRKRDSGELSKGAKKTKVSSIEKDPLKIDKVPVEKTFQPSLRIIDKDAIAMDINAEETSYLKTLLQTIKCSEKSRCKGVQTRLPCNKDILPSEEDGCLFTLKNLRNHLIYANIPVNTTFSKTTSIKFTNQPTSKMTNYGKTHKTPRNEENDGKRNLNVVLQNSIVLKTTCDSIQNLKRSDAVKSAKDTFGEIEASVSHGEKLNSIVEKSNKGNNNELTKTNNNLRVDELHNDKTVKIIGCQASSIGDETPNRDDKKVGRKQPLKIKVSGTESMNPKSGEFPENVNQIESGLTVRKPHLPVVPIKVYPPPRRKSEINSGNEKHDNVVNKIGDVLAQAQANTTVGNKDLPTYFEMLRGKARTQIVANKNINDLGTTVCSNTVAVTNTATSSTAVSGTQIKQNVGMVCIGNKELQTNPQTRIGQNETPKEKTTQNMTNKNVNVLGSTMCSNSVVTTPETISTACAETQKRQNVGNKPVNVSKQAEASTTVGNNVVRTSATSSDTVAETGIERNVGMDSALKQNEAKTTVGNYELQTYSQTHIGNSKIPKEKIITQHMTHKNATVRSDSVSATPATSSATGAETQIRQSVVAVNVIEQTEASTIDSNKELQANPQARTGNNETPKDIAAHNLTYKNINVYGSKVLSESDVTTPSNNLTAICNNSVKQNVNSAVSNTSNHTAGSNKQTKQLLFKFDRRMKTVELNQVCNSNATEGLPKSGPEKQKLVRVRNVSTGKVSLVPSSSLAEFAYPKIPPKRKPKDNMNDALGRNNDKNSMPPTKDNCDNTRFEGSTSSTIQSASVSSEPTKYVRVRNIADLM